MQTFLSYPSFEKSAQVLDNKRLNKQIVECYQILKAITLPDYGWQNHPAVNQWRGYEDCLFVYIWSMVNEYSKRFKVKTHQSYKNFCNFYTENYGFFGDEFETYNKPHWLGYEPFHFSHKCSLLRKNFNHYQKYFPYISRYDIENTIYYWPSKETAHLESGVTNHG